MPWLNRIAGRYLLPVWFAIFSAWYLYAIRGLLGLDARIYHRAASLWLAGGDPWSSGVMTPDERIYHFAGLPPTVLLYAPFAWIPEPLFAFLFVVASFAAGVWIVWRLRLAWWWILFPPLVLGNLSGNPGTILLALLLVRRPWAEAIAAGLKVYAVMPMLLLGRWRGLATFAGLCGLTVIAWSELWMTWASQFGAISARLVTEAYGGTGGTAHPALLVMAIAAIGALLIVDRRAAAWLAVPALWPAAQFHYAVMAMPVATVLLGFLLAPPIYGLPAIAISLYAWLVLWQRLRPEALELGGLAEDPAM